MKPLPFSDVYAASQARPTVVKPEQDPPLLRLRQTGTGVPGGFRATVPCWRPSRSLFGHGPAVPPFP